MNVLSLFDGMSGAQIALEKLGIKVNNYFAAEIDTYAIKIAKKNFPETIHLGDVCKIKAEDLPSIDLIVAGSPCQSFSRIGDGSGFDGSSKLFFEFLRILREVKPKYFLLENVVMKKEWQDIITEAVGVEPIAINSRLLSAQNRPRLYWTNIPSVKEPSYGCNVASLLSADDVLETSYTHNHILKDYLEGTFGGKRRKDLIALGSGKAGCLTASMYKGQIGSFIRNKKDQLHRLTPRDCEILQTVPIGYTEGVSNTQRYKMLGNGFTVDVIAHILSHMPTVSDAERRIINAVAIEAETSVDTAKKAYTQVKKAYAIPTITKDIIDGVDAIRNMIMAAGEASDPQDRKDAKSAANAFEILTNIVNLTK